MKKWQKQRNYRRIKDKEGHIVANVITVDNKDIEVSQKVFDAYSKMDRRERYISDEVEPGIKVSLDDLWESEMRCAAMNAQQAEDIASLIVRHEDENLVNQLNEALSTLDEGEKQLIQALFYDGVSAREYARRANVSDMTIRKRRDRVLDKLRKFFS